MATLARTDVLILDDLLLRPLSDDQAADLLEVVEDRRGRSLIATSQLPVGHWHEGLGDATVADAILDRLLERTHRIELTGASRRRGETTAPRAKNQPK
jgi:DNA replication protein DnaC